jgi:hypothetical protein
MLPLPVRLFVGEARRLLRTRGSLESLPGSIPEIYTRYLEQINPDNLSVPNFLTSAEMLDEARIHPGADVTAV